MKWNRLNTTELTASGDVLQSEDDKFLLIKNHDQFGTNYQLINLEICSEINKCKCKEE